MQKLICFILTLTVFLNIFVIPVSASVRSNVTITKVGAPTDPPPSGGGNTDSVLIWDTTINNALQQGMWGFYNRMQADITNGTYTAVKRMGNDTGTGPSGLYWCTNSVIDSYNLAGVPGLGAGHQAVVAMRSYWKTAPGYKYVDYEGRQEQALKEISPGYAVFFESVAGVHTGREHVAIVFETNLDDKGNGTLVTMDSNSGSKKNIYPVVGWSVKNTSYPIRGFGGV